MSERTPLVMLVLGTWPEAMDADIAQTNVIDGADIMRKTALGLDVDQPLPVHGTTIPQSLWRCSAQRRILEFTRVYIKE